jgi:hypothetical protein
MASVPYIFGTRSDQWTLSGLEVDADFQAIYDSLIDPTESPFGVEGRRIVIIDGTLSAPLTGMPPRSISNDGTVRRFRAVVARTASPSPTLSR